MQTVRAAVFLVVLLSALVSGCSDADQRPPSFTVATPTPSSKTISGGPNCKLPDQKSMPQWIPTDLPLPRGTYFYRQLPPKGGLNRGRLVVMMDAAAFGRYVRSHWPAAGYALARPDSEPGEVESLVTSKSRVGLYKANDVICDPPYVTLLLILE